MPKEGLKQFNEEEIKEAEPKEESRHIKLSWFEEEKKKKQEKNAEPISEEFSFLEEKRNEYVSAYQQHLHETSKWRRIFTRKKKEEELPEELRKSKSEYDEAKYAYCKYLIAAKRAELEKAGKSGEALENELAAYKFTAIYSKIFLEEKQLLQNAKIEGWPPKEKSILRKGLDLWMQQGKYTRLLISTSLLTGVSIATGGLAASGIGAAALFAGSRYAKGLTSAFIAQGVGKGVDWVFSKIFIDKVKQELEEYEAQTRESFARENLTKGELTLEDIQVIEAKRQQLTEKLAKREIVKVIAKAGAMIGTGAGVSIGLNWLENAYAGGGAGQLLETSSSKPADSGYEPKTDYNSFKAFQEGKFGVKVEEPAGVGAGAPAPEQAAETILESQRVEDLAIIKPGEGAWHAVYRQLENQLNENPAKFGLKPEDLENAAKIKGILIKETNKVLVDNDYIKPNGTEIRIAKPGGKVFLEPDNKINIEGEGKLTYEWTKPEIQPEEITTEENFTPAETTQAEPLEGDSLIQDFGDKNLAQQESIIGNFDQRAQALQNQFSLTDEFSPERYEIQQQLEYLASLKEQAVNAPSFIESHENFISYLYSLKKEIGLKFDEYGAIKNVKVGKFLEEISRYEKGEIVDEITKERYWPQLPHSGIYGGIELQHQLKLAETLKGILKVKAPEGGLDMTVDGLIKNHIGGVFK